MNIDKCVFRQKELVYLGYKVSAEGIKPDDTKIQAIFDMPKPVDKRGVQRLLAMVNHVAKFFPNISEITTPLRELTRKNSHWQWKKNMMKLSTKSKSYYYRNNALHYMM